MSDFTVAKKRRTLGPPLWSGLTEIRYGHSLRPPRPTRLLRVSRVCEEPRSTNHHSTRKRGRFGGRLGTSYVPSLCPILRVTNRITPSYFIDFLIKSRWYSGQFKMCTRCFGRRDENEQMTRSQTVCELFTDNPGLR